MARLVSLAILTTLIIFLGITFYQIVVPFLLPLFLAAVTAVWCQPLYGFFLKKLRNRDRLAAAVTTGSVLLALFIPLVIGVFSAAMELRDFATDTDDDAPRQKLAAVVRKLPAQRLSTDEFRQQVRHLAKKLLDSVERPPGVDATEDERVLAQAKRAERLESIDQHVAEMSQDAGKHLRVLAMKSLGVAASGGMGLASETMGVLGAIIGGLIGLTMFLIALYYFLYDGSALLSATEKLIPMQVDYQRQLIHEFTSVMQAVVTATMLSAIAQGAATAVMLFIVGFHSFFLLFVVATFASLIPVAGTWMVWGPFAAWLAYQGSWGSALFLAVVGIAVIGTMDNVIKAYVLQNDTSLHPLLAFVSVFGGMQVMGLWGIFVGPIVACCLHALVKIFNTELSEFSKEKLARTSPPESLPPLTESSYVTESATAMLPPSPAPIS